MTKVAFQWCPTCFAIVFWCCMYKRSRFCGMTVQCLWATASCVPVTTIPGPMCPSRSHPYPGHLDYCNLLYKGLPLKNIQYLQLVQNKTAPTVLRKPSLMHVSPIWWNLHWLPIKLWVEFKVWLSPLKPYMTWGQAVWRTISIHPAHQNRKGGYIMSPSY